MSAILETEKPGAAAYRLFRRVVSDGFKLDRLHVYRDAFGAQVFHRARFRHADGRKTFRAMHVGANMTWQAGEPKMPHKPLYRLPELLADPSAVVYVVEGESCADALAALGLVATTSGSCSSAATADWSPLESRSVVLWRDHDVSGAKYADDVTRALVAVGASVGRIDVPALGLAEHGDCVDWLASHPGATADTVRALAHEAAPERMPRVHLLSASDVQCQPIRWLWRGFLAQGKVHLLAGPPGVGKSTVGMHLCAIVSKGARWPDGTSAPCGSVVIWSGEDDAGDTLVPRLKAAGADLARVYIVRGVPDADGERPFDPARDVPDLVEEIRQLDNVRLVVVDPVASAVAGDSNANGEVRRALQPLVDLAGDVGAAVLGVHHFSKGTAGRDPTERVVGSVAFGALARVVLVAAKRPEGEEGPQRLFARSKSNIGPDGGGFAYDLSQVPIGNGLFASAVRWGEPLEGSARELLGEVESVVDDAVSEAERFLRSLLADGPVPSDQIRKDAAAAGVAFASVRRAKVRLGVVASKTAMSGGWHWSLPEGARPKNLSAFGKFEPLRDSDADPSPKALNDEPLRLKDRNEADTKALNNDDDLSPFRGKTPKGLKKYEGAQEIESEHLRDEDFPDEREGTL